MTSVNTNTAMPNNAWSVNPRRGMPRTRWSSGLVMLRRSRRARLARAGLFSVTARLARLRSGEAVMEARVLLPARARAPLHVGGESAVEQHHERQRHEQDPVDDRLLDVQVHEV